MYKIVLGEHWMDHAREIGEGDCGQADWKPDGEHDPEKLSQHPLLHPLEQPECEHDPEKLFQHPLLHLQEQLSQHPPLHPCEQHLPHLLPHPRQVEQLLLPPLHLVQGEQ